MVDDFAPFDDLLSTVKARCATGKSSSRRRGSYDSSIENPLKCLTNAENTLVVHFGKSCDILRSIQ